MADLSKKLFSLAGIATVFAGMAYGQQVTVGPAGVSSLPNFIRSEGTAEQVADTTVTFTGISSVPVLATITVFLSPAVPVTSLTVNHASEAVAVIGGVATPGVVSGSVITFTGIQIASTGGAVTITNIRVNASTIATGGGIPASISEEIFTSGTGVSPSVSPVIPVAYVRNGLGAVTASGATSNSICSPVTAASPNFTVSVSEAFATAFKSQDSFVDIFLDGWFVANTESGYYVTNGGGAPGNTAAAGTRFSVTFANIPSNVTLYVPLTLSSGAGIITLTSSATGAFSAVPASTSPSAPPNSAAVGSSGTVVYEETTNDPATIETYSIPVYLVSAANAVLLPTTPITATVSLAPIASSEVPNFVSNSSTTTVSGSTYIACSTTLLFPFVTNESGFETGIAIANTTTFGVTAPQAGTCTLNFYGSSSPAAYTTPSPVASGTDWAATLTSITGGVPGAFSGYAVATCNFLFAHGFSYISYNIGQSSGMAMGYLALEVHNPAARSASSAFPESLGF